MQCENIHTMTKNISIHKRRKLCEIHFPDLELSIEVKLLSRVLLFATPWTVAYKVPLSIEFSGQENWSRLPFPSPGNLPDPGIEPRSPALQADALPSEPPGNCP